MKSAQTQNHTSPSTSLYRKCDQPVFSVTAPVHAQDTLAET